jgi:hypothetical protein
MPDGFHWFKPILSIGELEHRRSRRIADVYSRAIGICTAGRSTRSPLVSALLPIDTAVAATTSETVSASVAISSMATACRCDSVSSSFGAAKPGLPAQLCHGRYPSRIIEVVITIAAMPAPVRPDWGEAALTKKGVLVGYG